MELGASTSYHSKSQPKWSHDDPKTIQFHVFQPHCFINFDSISQPGRKFSRSGPKIEPRPFPEQFRASKKTAECRRQQIKRSHDGPISAFQLRCYFGNFKKLCAFGAKVRPPAGQIFEKYMHLFGKGMFLTSFVPSAVRAGLRRVKKFKSTCTFWKT